LAPPPPLSLSLALLLSPQLPMPPPARSGRRSGVGSAFLLCAAASGR